MGNDEVLRQAIEDAKGRVMSEIRKFIHPEHVLPSTALRFVEDLVEQLEAIMGDLEQEL